MDIAVDFTALFLLYAALFFRKWRARGLDVLLVNSTLYLYLAFVLYFTLMPILVSLPFVCNHPYSPMNMVPFIDVRLGRGDFIRQVGLNILMTVPFGFLFPLTQRGNGSFAKTAAACFLLSLSIELLQPLINGSRSSDITDLITNVLGGATGYLFYFLFRPLTSAVLAAIKNPSKKTDPNRS